MKDLLYAVRALARRPAYALSATIVLALGVGATTTAFSLVNGALLRSLPFAGSQRIVEIWRNGPGGDRRVTLSQKEFDAIADRCTSLSTLAAYGRVTASFRGDNQLLSMQGAEITAGWFSLFGTTVAVGRPFTSADFQYGSASTLILSHEAWTNYFHRNPSIIGLTVYLDTKPYVVVGVSNADFASRYFPADFWLPAPRPGIAAASGPEWIFVLGELGAGVRLQQAQIQLSAVESSLMLGDPSLKGRALLAAHLKDVIGAGARTMLLALLAASGLLFLIACANVAFLGFLRNGQRRAEIELRQSLGASRLRILRMLMAENILIASSACAFGLLFAVWATHVIASRAAAYIPRATQLNVDGTVIAAAVGMWLLAVLGTGLVPVLLATNFRRESDLSSRQWNSWHSFQRRMPVAFVASEVALSLLLLSSFGLVSTSLVRLLSVNLGFNPNNILTFWVSAPGSNQRAYGVFFRNAQAQIAAVPGVVAAGAASNGFFSGSTATHYYLQGPPSDPDSMPLTQVRYVSPGFLRAVGVRLLKGRYFGEQGNGVGPEVMVNESFERSIASRIPFSHQRIYIWDRLRRVVGVVADLRDLSSPAEANPTVYVQFFDSPQGVGMFAVRTKIPPSSGLLAAIRRRIAAAGGDQPIYDVSTAGAIFSRILNPAKFRTTLLGLFALLAYLISVIGVYCVASYAVARRQREVGIRLALGATPRKIFAGHFLPGVRSALLGICFGIGASLVAMHLIASMLFETAPADPIVIGAVALLMAASACLACVGPAMRAMRLDPAAFLRYE